MNFFQSVPPKYKNKLKHDQSFESNTLLRLTKTRTNSTCKNMRMCLYLECVSGGKALAILNLFFFFPITQKCWFIPWTHLQDHTKAHAWVRPSIYLFIHSLILIFLSGLPCNASWITIYPKTLKNFVIGMNLASDTIVCHDRIINVSYHVKWTTTIMNGHNI